MGDDFFFRNVELAFYIATVSILVLYLPILISIFVLLPLGFKMYTKLTPGMCTSRRRIDGQTAIVTGANVGKTNKNILKSICYV